MLNKLIYLNIKQPEN